MNPTYYYQQQLYQYQYQQYYYGHNTFTSQSQYTQGSLFQRHLTPHQQWRSSFRGHQSYHYFQPQQRFNNQYLSGWSHLQWLQYYSGQFAMTLASDGTHYFDPSRPQWSTSRENNAVTRSTEGDQVDSNRNQREHQKGTVADFYNSDVNMVDISELDDSVDSPSEGIESIDTCVIAEPDGDAEDDNERDVSAVGSKNGFKDSRSLWIEKFAIDSQKNYDHMIAISKDWDAMKEKLATLKSLSKEIDQIDPTLL